MLYELRRYDVAAGKLPALVDRFGSFTVHKWKEYGFRYLIATNELMTLHVSRETRRGAPMAPAIRERLDRIQVAHHALPRPPQAGRRIGLGAAPTTR